jgi:alkanesulfonate monooxygenase SsuD/methylene tetrahydromethanopterin reductase-like flavin-dependent oxidoreductase (luciferase family)
MKIGLHLHPERGIDAIFEEARLADEQGFESMWLSDHLMGTTRATERPDQPLDAFTLMTALGACTQRIRLAWSTLHINPHYPPVLAKRLATLDQITRGRVTASVGSGWFYEELTAYNIPLIEAHDERSAYCREQIELLRLLWSNPAPALSNYEGKYMRVRDLPFNPAPYQQPTPPIWMGGDSPATMAIVKEKDLCDGWVPWATNSKEDYARVLSAPDWPKRPMSICRGTNIFVCPRRQDALKEARAAFDVSAQRRASRAMQPNYPVRHWPETWEEFLDYEVIGDPDDCLRKLAEIESWGVTHIRVSFDSLAHQERTAKLILPRLHELPTPVAV